MTLYILKWGIEDFLNGVSGNLTPAEPPYPGTEGPGDDQGYTPSTTGTTYTGITCIPRGGECYRAVGLLIVDTHALLSRRRLFQPITPAPTIFLQLDYFLNLGRSTSVLGLSNHRKAADDR
ncbi:hypothetical protein KCU71_g107, partial [Aureobasidium melanogenum]